jgi:surfeit locus 1 family protein
LNGRRSGVLSATVFAAASIASLVGLGIWQLDRKAWKEDLIATLNTRLARPPDALPPREAWPDLTAAQNEFSRVAFPAAFLPGQEALVYSAGSALRPDVRGPGYWVFAPARLAGGNIVLVNRGFVPPDHKDPLTRQQGTLDGSVDIVGVLRWPEERGLFSADDDVKNSIWFTRDPQAMAEAKGWQNVAPFYVDQESPVPPGGWPRPGKLAVQLRNTHLQYAITWFGLALGLAGVYVIWLARRLHGRS